MISFVMIYAFFLQVTILLQTFDQRISGILFMDTYTEKHSTNEPEHD